MPSLNSLTTLNIILQTIIIFPNLTGTFLSVVCTNSRCQSGLVSQDGFISVFSVQSHKLLKEVYLVFAYTSSWSSFDNFLVWDNAPNSTNLDIITHTRGRYGALIFLGNFFSLYLRPNRLIGICSSSRQGPQREFFSALSATESFRFSESPTPCSKLAASPTAFILTWSHASDPVTVSRS